MFERSFDGIETVEDVGMVEFEIVDDSDLGQIMYKLAALIEEGRVVFVPLNNEPFAIRKSRALPEIVGDPADQVAWV